MNLYHSVAFNFFLVVITTVSTCTDATCSSCHAISLGTNFSVIAEYKLSLEKMWSSDRKYKP